MFDRKWIWAAVILGIPLMLLFLGAALFFGVNLGRDPDLQQLQVLNTTGEAIRVYSKGSGINFTCGPNTTCVSPERVYRGSVQGLRAYNSEDTKLKSGRPPKRITKQRTRSPFAGTKVTNILEF